MGVVFGGGGVDDLDLLRGATAGAVFRRVEPRDDRFRDAAGAASDFGAVAGAAFDGGADGGRRGGEGRRDGQNAEKGVGKDVTVNVGGVTLEYGVVKAL